MQCPCLAVADTLCCSKSRAAHCSCSCVSDICALQQVVVGEIVLFGSFGLVQLLENFYLKGRSRQSELIYIALSLLAKGALGGTLFANVLFV